MILRCNDKILVLEKTQINFSKNNLHSIFRTKNNKTLGETLDHPKYKSLKEEFEKYQKSHFEKPLGKFLYNLKKSSNTKYLKFLNKHGDNIFCEFNIETNLEDKGIYAWVVEDEIKYIGRCTDNFKKRVNQGYGRINAKNCYRDGQSTNCHLNSKINECKNVDFYVYKMNEKTTIEINNLEFEILKSQNFEWNIQNN
ncbi:MAG: hypothetical protein COA97_07695 [Flavobacteriales bacterium]|nr:MAG: hypothetical protein COA97_07695 [Flavobacteriales bacterium]